MRRGDAKVLDKQMFSTLERELTYLSPVVNPINNERATVTSYQMSGDLQDMYIPRSFAQDRLPDNSYEMEISEGEDVRFDNCRFTPRTNAQSDFVNGLIQGLRSRYGVLGKAMTGAGKTAMTMPVIAAMGKKTLILLSKSDLIDSWIDNAVDKNIMGLDRSDIGIVRGECIEADKKIVIGMVQSIMNGGKLTDSQIRSFGLVVIDECHSICTDRFSRTIGMFPARYRMALSATPKRKDGFDKILENHIGEAVVTFMSAGNDIMTPTVYIINTGYKIPEVGKNLMNFYNRIKKVTPRDRFVVGAAIRLAEGGRQTVVFCSSLAKVDMFEELFREKGIEVGKYIGSTKAKDREAETSKQIIVATYGMLKEGTNIPSLCAGIFTVPYSDVRQLVGRFLRKKEGKQSPVILDLVDSNGFCQAMLRKRTAGYNEYSAKFRTINMKDYNASN